MRALIDTNIVIDVLAKREKFFEASSKVFKLSEVKQVEGVISAITVPNVVYILRKQLCGEKIGEVLQTLLLIFKVEDLKGGDLLKAEKLKFADYEDALQSVCASRVKADYIITRNVKDFKSSKVKAVTPEDFLDLLK